MSQTTRKPPARRAAALLVSAALALSASAGTAGAETREVLVDGHRMIVDLANREVRIGAAVTRDDSKAGIAEWGKRGAAWFGCAGGKAEAFFIFTTKVDRGSIDQALREIGLTSRRQISGDEVKKRTGLKPETTAQDYLDGDPLVIGVRFEKDGKLVERALEDFIAEKILVQGVEVVKPYTPHWIYHGTAEAVGYPSGCVSCPEDCWGGVIADNSVPVLTTDRWYKVDWEKMPPVGSKVEIVLKSIYGPNPLSALR